MPNRVRSEDLFADRRGRFYVPGRRMRRRHFPLAGVFQQPRRTRICQSESGSVGVSDFPEEGKIVRVRPPLFLPSFRRMPESRNLPFRLLFFAVIPTPSEKRKRMEVRNISSLLRLDSGMHRNDEPTSPPVGGHTGLWGNSEEGLPLQETQTPSLIDQD